LLHGYRGAFVATAALFVVTFLWLYPAPVLLSHQGRHSLLAAQSLNAGHGFEVTPEIPFAKFGPFYPLALAFLGRLGLGVGPAVHLINCAALAGALLGLYALCRLLGVRGPVVALVLYGLLAANYLLLRSARPDLIVVCAATLALVAFVAYAQRHSMSALLAAAVCSSVAATSRYMAVLALLPMMLVALWLGAGSWRTRVRDLTIFVSIGAGPVMLWMARNYHVTGFITGMSRTKVRRVAPDEFGLLDQLRGMLSTIWIDVFSPDTLGLRRVVYGGEQLDYQAVMLGATLIAAGAAAGLVWLRRRELATFFSAQARRRTVAFHAVVLVAGYVVLYTLVLIVVWSLSNNDPIYTRYVSPLYGYAIVLASLAVTVATQGAPGRLRLLPALIFLSIAVPNLPKTARLLGHERPPRSLVTVQEFGDHGNAWVSDLDWGNLDEIRPRRP
jgi:hypothetical protein